MEKKIGKWLKSLRTNVKESISEMEEVPEPVMVDPYLGGGIASSVPVQDVQWKSFPTEEITLGKIDNAYWNFY